LIYGSVAKNLIQLTGSSNNKKYKDDSKPFKWKQAAKRFFKKLFGNNHTLDSIAAMRMIQKGQVRHVAKTVVKQNSFVRRFEDRYFCNGVAGPIAFQNR
jgi:hypothetical protein